VLPLMVLTLAATRVMAQAQDLSTSARGAASAELRVQARVASLLAVETRTNQAGLSLGKKLHVGGPVVSGFGARKILDVPRRVLRFINPFTPVENTESFEKTAKVNPRAWTTIVGLRPGASAFEDVTTHESSMTLLTLGRRTE